MAGGYTTPNDDALDQLRSELMDARRRLDELERPTGSQQAQTVGSVITPQVANNVNTSFLITTSSAVFAALNFFVPTGFTKALVFATATASETPVNTIERIQAKITIASDVGAEVFGYCDGSIGGSVSISHASIQTSLVAGNSIPVVLNLRNLVGNSGTGTASKAVLTAFAIFQK